MCIIFTEKSMKCYFEGLETEMQGGFIFMDKQRI